jgi:hypothetical protein
MFAVLAVGVLFVGCVQSPDPMVEDLVTVSPPSFNGSADSRISTSSSAFRLIGDCDPNAYKTEYSYDNATWIEVPCEESHFIIPLIVSNFKSVYARSKGKFSYTTSAKATVRFLLPPTSDSIIAGSSARSDNSDLLGPGTQNFMAPTFQGKALQNTTVKVHSQLPRLVYEH